jgi:hypothetical protein
MLFNARTAEIIEKVNVDRKDEAQPWQSLRRQDSPAKGTKKGLPDYKEEEDRESWS